MDRVNKYLFSCLLVLSVLGLQAQNSESKRDKELIQFSGVVLTHDSLTPVPYTSVMIKGTNRGTLCDYYGFFSFVAAKGDTIQFSCIGFKRASYVIPDSLTGDRYSLIQVLLPDNIFLKEISIYAFPTRDQFRQAFMNLKIPNDDYERAKLNLDQQIMLEKYETLSLDGKENYALAMQRQTAILYHTGQYPSYNIFNPIAWAKFIQAWKNGDLKDKRKK